jgi:hypothetical protein
MASRSAMGGENPSKLLDHMIAELGDWRGEMIARIRKVMRDADPEMVLEWKWMGTPTWYRDGVVAIVNPHVGKVKMTFAQGAKLPDPDKLFNAGLGGNLWRAVDILETDALNEKALKNLVRAAVALNRAQVAERGGAKPRKAPKPAPRTGRNS